MGGYENLIITRRITAGPSCLLAQLTSITGATHCFYSTIYIRKRIYTKNIYTKVYKCSNFSIKPSKDLFFPQASLRGLNRRGGLI